MTAGPQSQTLLEELISLTWVSLGQSHPHEQGPIDDETHRYFHEASRTIQLKKTPCQPTATGMIPPEAATQEKPHVNERAAPASTDVPSTRREQSHIEVPDSQPQESSSYEPTARQPEPQRLHKLLPRPFNAPTTDTSATRERIAADHTHVRLSAVPYSYDVAASTERTSWAFVTYIAGNPSYPTAKEKFVDSVKEAIEGKLAVNVSIYQCADPTFALQLPIIANDHEVILMFVDAHLQTTLATLLESVPSYARSPLELESPFMCLGSVHERALRGLILHATTHEDQSFKGQLWRSLKALATHSSP